MEAEAFALLIDGDKSVSVFGFRLYPYSAHTIRWMHCRVYFITYTVLINREVIAHSLCKANMRLRTSLNLIHSIISIYVCTVYWCLSLGANGRTLEFLFEPVCKQFDVHLPLL